MNKRGQSVAEMAIFGSLIFMVFGILISFSQQFNDQQYAHMKAFRLTLEKACNYVPNSASGAGASVQLTLIENRRNMSLGGGYQKGNPSSVSGSASIYWSVPRVEKGATTDSILAFKINDDERQINYNDYIPKEHKRIDPDTGNENPTYWSYELGDMTFKTDSQFTENSIKTEDRDGITNHVTSDLKQTVFTDIPYKIVEKHSGDSTYEQEVPGKRDKFWNNLSQGLYWNEASGQYQYGQAYVGTTVQRGKEWTTPF